MEIDMDANVGRTDGRVQKVIDWRALRFTQMGASWNTTLKHLKHHSGAPERPMNKSSSADSLITT
jgi:hypothetical protein